MKALIKKAVTAVSVKAGRMGLKCQKYAPELLLAFGFIAGAGATVTACVATSKADEVLDKHREAVDKAHEARQIVIEDHAPDEYTEKDEKMDVVIAYRDMVFGFVRLYALPVALGALSLGSILTSYGIMRKRNLALIAAYTALDGAFKAYRKRVIDEVGEDMDRHYRYGTEVSKFEVTKDNGKGKVKTEVIEDEVFPENGPSKDYAFIFDESNPNWTKDMEANMYWAGVQEVQAEELLQARGHLFLNEVRDMFSLPRTAAGAVTGWVLGNGDDHVDLRIYEGKRVNPGDPVRGFERFILLDPNVDGVIYDKI